MSAMARTGVREVLYRAAQKLAEAAPLPVEEELPVYRAVSEGPVFVISREDDGGYRVKSPRIERAASMTYWEHDQAVERFQRILETLGVRKALSQAGIKDGDTVYIGEFELEWTD